MEQILTMSGVNIDLQNVPILAQGRYGKKSICVYPAMWAKPEAADTVYLSDTNLKYAKPYALKSIVDVL